MDLLLDMDLEEEEVSGSGAPSIVLISLTSHPSLLAIQASDAHLPSAALALPGEQLPWALAPLAAATHVPPCQWAAALPAPTLNHLPTLRSLLPTSHSLLQA